ncbi:MAG TPA: hypothetical protein VIR03_02205 [Candidatus Saccharimonadales bacterium]
MRLNGSPEQFARVNYEPPADTDPRAAELGAQLRARYRRCAEGFRAIVGCARPQQVGHASWLTVPIKLGRCVFSDWEEVDLRARVRLDEYRAAVGARAIDARTASLPEQLFGVTIDWLGALATGESLTRQSHLGARCYVDHHIPTFIANPDSLREEPYQIPTDTLFLRPTNVWTMPNYAWIVRGLGPPLADAEKAQQMIQGALCNPELNPEFAPVALQVFQAA